MPTFAPGSFANVPDTLEVAGKLVVGFAKLPSPVALTLRMRMLDATHDCGCTWAAGAGSTLLSAYLLVSLLVPLLRSDPTMFSWWWALGAMFGGSLIGKTIGTFRAKRALQAAIAEFNQLVAQAAK